MIAIGNPFGLGGSVSAGIVSARERVINSGPYDDFIQTDAAINKGNSGGPMFNLDGRVIGINSVIISPSGGSAGIGFAIASNLARNVIEQLRDYGRVRRGWLGVRIQTVTDELAEGLRLESATGALVASVTEGGPAEAAGIGQGDVILRFDGREVGEMRKLPRMVAETRIGKAVDVVVWRKGVAGAPEERRLGIGHVAELRRRGLADQDGPGLLQPGDADRIRLRHVLRVDVGGEGRAHAGGVDQVLDVQRHPVQRTDRLAARQRRVGRLRIGPRLFGTDRDEAVERRLHPLGTRQHVLDDLGGRDPLLADQRRQRSGGGGGKVGLAHGVSPSEISLLVSIGRLERIAANWNRGSRSGAPRERTLKHLTPRLPHRECRRKTRRCRKACQGARPMQTVSIGMRIVLAHAALAAAAATQAATAGSDGLKLAANEDMIAVQSSSPVNFIELMRAPNAAGEVRIRAKLTFPPKAPLDAKLPAMLYVHGSGGARCRVIGSGST